MSTIDVVLSGSNRLFRQGLRQMLDPAQFVIVAERRDFASVRALIAEGLRPELVIADFSHPQERDSEGLRLLRQADDACRIVVLTNELDLSEMARALNAGANGYLVNELSVEAFCLSLMLVMKGEKVLPSPLASMLASNTLGLNSVKLLQTQHNLTHREAQILRCLSNGYSNKLIARALDTTEAAVKACLKSLMKKIAADNRTQAALWARNHGIAGRTESVQLV